MEKNNLITEEVNRIRLLFKYDSQQTLSENLESLDEAGILGSLLRGDAALAKTAARELEVGVSGLRGGVRTVDNILLRDAEEIIIAVKAGKLSSAELGKVNASLLKNTTNPAVKTAVIQDVVSTGSFARKYGRNTEAEAIAALEAKGWTTSDAKAAVNEYKSSGKSFKVNSGATPNTTTPAPIPNRPTNWQQFKDKIRGLSRNKTVRFLGFAGGTYLIYKWLTSKGTTPFPICLTTNMSTEDLQRMNDEGVDDIFIGKTGNSTIDMNGGGRFSDNGTFKTANGKYSGDWSEENGGIAITIGGQSYNMACGVVDSDEQCPEGQSWDGEKCVPVGPNPNPRPWVNCTTFPYKRGCKNNDLVEIQKCLGISSDGKFGKDTERALKDKGYDTIITKELYDKIMSNCGNTTTTTTRKFVPDETEIGFDEINN